MQTHNFSDNNFTEYASSILVLTELNKKAIDRNDCSTPNFVLVLLYGNIYTRSITLKSKKCCVATAWKIIISKTSK